MNHRPEVTGRRAGAVTLAIERRYVDLKTFMAMFGLGKTRVYRLVAAGVFTRLKLGGRSRFIVEEGEAYMTSLPTGQRQPP
jgi:predicted DNA-binding transcriptional regulator AlpA